MSRFSNISPSSGHVRNQSGFSKDENYRASVAESEGEEIASNNRRSEDKEDSKYEIETIKKIRQSTFNRKSSEFESMIRGLTNNFNSDEVT